ncbi:SGNH/GDSL hydrolase family protein [Thiocapsa rosea]|uniref:SGNH/GDSL hydrolase family protein n=1 Tax=Thiocapsa rosea TaxID=69360 RepID=UPI000EB4272C|nr:SGNH/GDSL hydrolase family protein [Thiocapsa rosea]
MRSANFAAEKPAGEFRVMVFGDSVLNGGNLTDHGKLATTLVADRLAAAKGRPVAVGNISAGSWGPGNWLAYAREFGFFDADVVLLLISSHDIGDNPTFAPLDPNTHPQKQPLSALAEGIGRYLPRYLPAWASGPTKVAVVDPMAQPIVTNDDQAVAQGGEDLRTFLDLARSQVPRVLVVQFPDHTEFGAGGLQPGYELVKSIAQESGVEVISVFPEMKAALDRGANPYRDNIHINDLGQAILADAFFDALAGREVTRKVDN